MKSNSRIIARVVQISLTILTCLLILSGCGRRDDEIPPTATLIPRRAASLPPTATPYPPVALLNHELLAGDPSLEFSCDHPAEVEIECAQVATRPRLQGAVNASTYARWLLRWGAVSTPLTGYETIAINLERSGDLTPNLYLVEASGVRQYLNLGRYGLREGENELHIPLQEFIDDAGNRPNFADVTELQLVLEWADMAGELTITSVRFETVWQQAVTLPEKAFALAESLEVPVGFVVEPIAHNLQQMTQVDFTPSGDLLVSLQTGRVWWLQPDERGDYTNRHLYTAGHDEIVGLLYDSVDEAIWLGGRGQLYRTWDSDGDRVADQRELQIDGLPWGRHQNNGLAWNPDPDPFTGEAGHQWLYFGLGSTGDMEDGGDLNSTVLRFPRTGQGQDDLEVVSRGNRNPYMIVWASVPVDLNKPDGEKAWQLFASENGPDFNDAPDEVNHIRWKHHFGFPEQFGPVADDATDGDPYSGPIYPVAAHASASGLAYIDNPQWPAPYRTLYTTLFGEVFVPDLIGHTVERVILSEEITDSGKTYRGTPDDFVVGLDRPLPMATDLDGNLIVGDYATGILYRVRYVGP